MKKLLKIWGIIIGLIISVIAIILVLHLAGRVINNKTPKDGINESMYVNINGTDQWINIYGKNKDNPVLLYLHGGPGSSTSQLDYMITRKWADVYTIVTWDQRNCGKSYHQKDNGTVLTYEILMEDGKQMTEFILDYTNKDKLTLLGHSWGSIYGANLVLTYPQYYDCFIGTGQLVDVTQNEEAFKKEATKWASGDSEGMALVNQLTPENMDDHHIKAKDALMVKYGYSMMRDGSDYFLPTTILFNPHYSLKDWYMFFQVDMSDYLNFYKSDEFKKFSLLNRYDYEVSYYNINGSDDYQTNYNLAKEYFDLVNAPTKQFYTMEDTTHGLLESKSKWFSEYVHQIASLQ